jgi:anti-sigma-K factor RskA
MSISCEQADEMLAALAMNRLDREDEAEMTAHLAGCRRHDAELAEFRALAGALPAAVEELTPPAGLRSSLLDAFEREAAPQRAARGPVREERPRGGFLAWLSTPRFAYGLAAALAVAVIGLAAWNVSLQSKDEGVLVRTIEQQGMSLKVLYFKDRQLAVLDVVMPALPPNRTYQAWKIDAAGQPVSLGLLSDKGAFAFHTDLAGAQAIAISVEPPGGSAQPTTTPVLVEEL